MTRNQIVTAALAVMMAAGIAAFAGSASAAGFMPWEDVIKMAAQHQGMVTMEDATSFSQREKQFAGFAPWVSENMKILDKNGDGMVSKEEIHDWMIANHVNNDDLVKIWYQQAK